MRTAGTMTLERFKTLVGAYGGSEEAWPTDERVAAAALLRASAEARTLREEAAALDMAMTASETAVPSAALEARILASFKQESSRGSSRYKWLSAGAIAACLVVGVMAAWPILQPAHDVDLSDPAAWDLIGEDLEFPVSKG